METKDYILASAQRLVQQRGFNGFSYADVAQEVGIRKASLHHHFATKAALGVELINSYALQFDQELARIEATFPSALARLQAYLTIYRSALEAGRICLCGMLATETLTLDASMLPRLKRFFARNTEWLTEVLAQGKAQQAFAFEGAAADHARAILSTLQGAALICRATGDLAAFDRTAALLTSDLSRSG